MPTAERPKAESFTIDKVEPIQIERRLSPEMGTWQYRAKRPSSRTWSFWYPRSAIERAWSITLPPDPEIPKPRQLMPIEVYDDNGAIAISDEEVRVRAFDLRIGDHFQVERGVWKKVEHTLVRPERGVVEYRLRGGVNRNIASWATVAIKSAE